MKQVFCLLGLGLLLPACAQAQVRIDPSALQQLQGVAPVSVPAPIVPVIAKPPVYAPPHHHTHIRPQHVPHAPEPPQTTDKKPVAPKPVAPAPLSTLPKLAVQPEASITFAPDSAILPANAQATLQPFCTSKMRIPITARAPATPDNPGIAMQLSMQRAFAVRAALISCGVPSQNIIPQSTGGSSAPNNNETLIGVGPKP